MKSLSAFNQTAVDNPNVDVIRLVEIAFSGLTLYLTDRTWGAAPNICKFNGQVYEPVIHSWDSIEMGAIDPVEYSGTPGRCSFVVDNNTPIGGYDRFTLLAHTNPPHYATVTIKEIFNGASAAGDAIAVFKGQVEDLLDMASDRVTVTCTSYELNISNKFIYLTVETNTYPNADPDDVGKMLPQVWGQAKKVPFLAINAGSVTTLSEDITSSSTTVKLSSSFGFTGTGTILIDSEQISYTGITGNNLTGCTRGVNGTTAVSHNKGAAIGEIQDEYIYAIGHPVNAIDAVYVNGVLQQTDIYTAYTGQAGDQHATYPDLACVSFPSWPQITKDVDLDVDVSGTGGPDTYRRVAILPVGHVITCNPDGTILNYDHSTTITFPAEPSGTSSDIYAEYTFDLMQFGTPSGSRDFYIDGTLVASYYDGSLREFVTSPLRVYKGAWPTTANKSITWRDGGNAGLALVITDCVVYCKSTSSEISERGTLIDYEATNIPLGSITTNKTVDIGTSITFPAAPTGNLVDMLVTISWDYQQWGDYIFRGTPRHLSIAGKNVVFIDAEGNATNLLPGTFSIPYGAWQTSIAKSRSTLEEFARGESLVIRSASQSCFTDDTTLTASITGNSMADSVIGGLVSVDVDGWQDDGAGTYTGTPDALIGRPDSILKHLLVARCGLTTSDIDTTSYTSAGTYYSNNNFTLAVVVLTKPDVRELINRIAYQSRSIEFWEAGVHYIQSEIQGVTKTVSQDRIDLNQMWLSFTDRAAIANTLSARYARDWSGYEDQVGYDASIEADRSTVVATNSDSITRYGVLSPEQLSFPYITTNSHAQAVLDWVVTDLALPRLLVEFVGGYNLTDLERGDTISFDFAEGDFLYQAILGLVSAGGTNYLDQENNDEILQENTSFILLETGSGADPFRVLDVIRRPDHTIQVKVVQV